MPCFTQHLPWDIPNRYARFLGYNIEFDNATLQDFVILPNGDKVRPFSFLNGLTGQEYSYCARKGMSIENATFNIH